MATFAEQTQFLYAAFQLTTVPSVAYSYMYTSQKRYSYRLISPNVMTALLEYITLGRATLPLPVIFYIKYSYCS